MCAEDRASEGGSRDPELGREQRDGGKDRQTEIKAQTGIDLEAHKRF